jgi:hypothetical protein
MLGRIATLMSTPATTLDEWTHNLGLAQKLLFWLPFTDEIKSMNPKQRKAWATMFVLKERFEQQTQDELHRQMTQSPGSPRTTSNFAVRAMELHLQKNGLSWNEIAASLPCDWTMVSDAANSIRREVQLLRATLRECGVALENL